MDRVDRLRQLLDGAACVVCGATVPATAVRVVAEREDLAFVEIRCGSCGCASLGMVTEAGLPEAGLPEAGGEPTLRPLLELPDQPPRPGIASLELTDVEAMRDFLAGYQGDLRSLLDGPRRRPAQGS
jgi:hypothetical protein